jgi:hypothetical protein
MAVHMVRVFAEPPKGEAESAVDNWVSNYAEWDGDPIDHTLTETTVGIDGTQHVRGDWRFEDQGEDATNILRDLSERLQSFQGGLWHRLGYHVCSHDEDNGGPCSWGEMVEWGSVPSDIPDFKVR